jgi:hypothetical protein
VALATGIAFTRFALDRLPRHRFSSHRDRLGGESRSHLARFRDLVTGRVDVAGVSAFRFSPTAATSRCAAIRGGKGR